MLSKSIFFSLSTTLFLLIGCDVYDIGKAKSEKIVGNIYVFNLNIPEDSGFYLISRRSGVADRYLFKDYEYVDYLTGNDSMLMVKTIVDSNIRYHLLRHNRGDTVLSMKNLTDSEFRNYEHTLENKYYFNAREGLRTTSQ